MSLNVIAGVILLAGALGVIVFLTLWSRHIIERIHSRFFKEGKRTQNGRS